jgi:two-component system OmpR family response regulator
MRTLLAEDDRMIGEAVANALSDASYAVDWVRDGDAACTALDSHVYDIILLDLGLPKKDALLSFGRPGRMGTQRRFS